MLCTFFTILLYTLKYNFFMASYIHTTCNEAYSYLQRNGTNPTNSILYDENETSIRPF